MTREEINDLLEINYDNNRKWLVNYIFTLESDYKKYKEATKLAKEMIENSVSKNRYNNLVVKYNRLVRKVKQSRFVDTK